MPRKLYIPGPTDISKDVLDAQTKPMIGHRHKDFTALYTSVIDKLVEFFNTKQHITVFTASGTLLMDVAVRNLIRPGKKALCCVNGSFSKRMYETVLACDKEADMIDIEWGKAPTPELIEAKLKEGEYDIVTLAHNETSTGVKADLTKIGEMLKTYPETFLVVDAVSSLAGDSIYPERDNTDFIFASTQKAFALPPGLAVAIVSERALTRARDVPGRGGYTDLVEMIDFYAKRNQTPSTPAISLLYAMEAQLIKMLAEGYENIYKRHLAMADLTRKWAIEKGFEMFPEPGYESVTVSTIKNTKELSVSELNKALAERGMEIANGYGKLKDVTFRIGHMGIHTVESIQELLNNINEIWNL